MSGMLIGDFGLGAFTVSPKLNQLSFDGTNYHVEPLIMEVLVVLARNAGEAVLRNDLMDQVWAASEATDDRLNRAISLLRKSFAIYDPSTLYIETIPKRGYRIHPDLFCSLSHTNASAAVSESVREQETNRLYLQGKSLLERPFTQGVLPTAISLLEQAVVLDNKYAEAHSTLGHAYSQLATYSEDGDKLELVKRAADSAERAVQLDPNMGFPLTLIAMHRFVQSDMVGALDLAYRAYELEPDNSEVLMRLGYFLAVIGRTREAIPLYEKAVSLDPAQGRNLQNLAIAKLCNDDLREAEVLAKSAIDLQHLFAHETYAAIAYAMGKHDLAASRFTDGCYALFKMFGENFSDPEKWKQYSGLVFSTDPNIRRAVAQWVRQLCYEPGTPASIPLMTGLLRTGAAADFFEVCGDKPPPGSHGVLLRIWGGGDTCRMIYTHPQFYAFAERLGMVDAWDKYGLPDRLE